MAKIPAKKSSRLSPMNLAVGPRLVTLGAVLFVATRIIKWLPLGILGSWVNGILWPVVLVSIVAGGGLMYLKSKRS